MINKTEQIVASQLQKKQSELNRICMAYQTHLYQELMKAVNSYEVRIKYDYVGHFFLDKTGTKYPISLYIQNRSNENIDALHFITQKYNKVQQLRETLFGKNIWENQENFETIFNDIQTVRLIGRHRDSFALLFLKNLAYTLSSVIFGAGLIASHYTKNSYSFWRSHGAITMDALQEVLIPASPLY
ncbi:MAG: hypothetical protein Q8M03_15670 [Legionella sp.]|nr:hypothetical protein [Legionella sp.]